jgi:hypothetical protein
MQLHVGTNKTEFFFSRTLIINHSSKSGGNCNQKIFKILVLLMTECLLNSPESEVFPTVELG